MMWALLCVLAISSGQLLFKRAGQEIQAAGTWFAIPVLLYVAAAALVYGSTTLLWINLLRYAPLNKAYLFMAFSFIIVPLGSRAFFHEPITTGFVAGVFLIVVGLVTATVWN
jgi:drug/metabolite transporter (DMT)-like permease